jgi:hypothetical protein
MPYLFNIRVDVIREYNNVDDAYGGSLTTGTTIYTSEQSRLDQYNVNINDTSRQGMETRRSFNFYIRSTRQQPRTVKENDIIKIVFPPHHMLYNAQFRVTAVNYESFHPSDIHGLLELATQRIVESRSQQ